MFNELKAIAKDEGVLLFFILLPIEIGRAHV